MICVCCGREIGAEGSMICWNCQHPWENVLKVCSNTPPDDTGLCIAACKTKCRRNMSQYDMRNQIVTCADFSATCPAYAPKEE